MKKSLSGFEARLESWSLDSTSTLHINETHPPFKETSLGFRCRTRLTPFQGGTLIVCMRISKSSSDNIATFSTCFYYFPPHNRVKGIFYTPFEKSAPCEAPSVLKLSSLPPKHGVPTSGLLHAFWKMPSKVQSSRFSDPSQECNPSFRSFTCRLKDTP